ncbi:uncharacterized protein LOC100825569 isoform X3 [Brachypodium distachyon]|uniref:F-box domain-containing protein n=1 Tax=Brachypodium distachyon TaxID=15368 RepID=A0A0Q3JZL4_BRADI|nr:uncharacterized protein LOC100825569 isoform X3 [Brachypodium distachyon]KQK22955.1 hypothetical protein BRADI_1g70312v3 [Brachypodium distachyon]|eukprot:XP_014756057.1 uncharacterized protein LOC100825569 isoform X3 [Brachypodium distachyon]
MSMAALPDDLVEQILFRLPSDDPWCFARASVVCTLWHRLISHPAFLLRRLSALPSATPMLLGFLLDEDGESVDEDTLAFFPTSAFSLPVPDRRSWSPRDCRHGRVLFCSRSQDARGEFLVWEPVTGMERLVPVPAAYEHRYSNSAVVCAADGCDHRDCHGGPFRVVVLFSEQTEDDEMITWACVYSSETDAWGELTSVHGICSYTAKSSVLVRRSTLYFSTNCRYILEYDLSTHSLTRIDSPPAHRSSHHEDEVSYQIMALMVAEDGGLGIAKPDDWVLYLWSRDVSDAGDAEWVCYREIDLNPDSLLPHPALWQWEVPIMMGFAEEAITIFMSTTAGIFVIDLQSGRVKQVCDHEFSFDILVPIVSLGHTLPAPLREYHYPPSPNSSEEEEEEDDDDDGGGSDDDEDEEVAEEEPERAYELFVKGCKAIEQRDFVNAVDCLSHALAIRAAHYGEHAPQCVATYYTYGCALLYKAREESVKSTTSKAYAGNSKASGGNVEGAPSMEEVDTEEGDEEYSDLNLSRKMLNIARTIVEKSPGNTMECIISALGKGASSAEGSTKSIQDNEMWRTRILAKLERKLEEVEQAVSTPSCAAVEIMKRVAPEAEQNVDNAVSRAAPLISSQMAGLNSSFASPVIRTSTTTGNAESSVTDRGAVGGGIRRANTKPSSAEPSPKRLAVAAADDSP